MDIFQDAGFVGWVGAGGAGVEEASAGLVWSPADASDDFSSF